MHDQMFRDVPGQFQLTYIRTLACHYLMQLETPGLHMNGTCSALGLSRSTITGHWKALEAYYGSELIERDDKRGRGGRLTPFGKMVGALAAHFWSYDYLLRSGKEVADLGAFWGRALVDDTEGMGKAAEHLISLMSKRYDEVRDDDMEDDT